uniref:PD-(D/E)XK nuclease family protein n=1 Tax=Roseihalotalea indica TaxID=2867963 RepID=A0AA49GRW1_9BACT|nr:PD-(D/E)XK nuclease family protein [Tunicatimonas sp. TK19036]
MASFLEEVSNKILAAHPTDLAHLTFVYPNRRAGLFFQEILAQQINRTEWGPQMFTFQEFAEELSGLQIPDHLTLLFSLYQVFTEKSQSNESFDHFYFWGDLLLRDFDEIDKALVKTTDLFANLKDLKELEANYDYLTQEQRNAITRFWRNFQHGQPTSSKEQFLRFWSILHQVYNAFTQQLNTKGWAYEGWMLRQLAEKIASQQIEHSFQKVIFVGLHALAPAEEKLVRWFIEEENAEIYWDTDAYYVEHARHEAGHFFRKYRQHPVWRETLPDPLPQHYQTGQSRNLQAIGVTLNVGQAKQAGNILRQLSRQSDFVPEKTVVVLPDENLLFPMLHSLPSEIEKVNVTMGYPVRSTALYSLIEHVLALQEEKRYNKTTEAYEFHHVRVLALMRHPYLLHMYPERAQELIQDIEKRNQVYVSTKTLQQHPLYQVVFQPVTEARDTFDYLIQILQRIHQGAETSSMEGDQLTLPLLEQELVYQLFTQVNRLKALAQEHQFTFSPQLFVRIFRQIMQSLRLPFTGEPVRGLQVMGVLETRNLDFDNVIILSFNEGVYPKSEAINTFIPGNLRRGFGLPTGDEQDAIYAYTFYRLLHRAKQVYLLYNTEDSTNQNGEMSRFLYQLTYESVANADGSFQFPDGQGDYKVTRQTLSTPVRAIPAEPITIEKNTDVLARLHRYTRQPDHPPRRSLTPSALNTYLDCRLKFYYKYVVDLKEPEVVQEEVDPAVFGNLLHRAMELVYQSVLTEDQRTVVREMIEQLKKDQMSAAVKDAFREHYGQEGVEEFMLEGRNVIAYDIVRKMARRILDMDIAYAPFEIISLEREGGRGYFWETTLEAKNTSPTIVSLRGIIDRIDRKENVVRVLDYKTGRDEKKAHSIESLFDRDDKKRNKAAFQALFYALLYQQNSDTEERIVPGLVNAKDLFAADFDSRIILDKHPVNDYAPWDSEFRKGLNTLLLELFNPTIPFDQTTDLRKCSLCPYAKLCY